MFQYCPFCGKKGILFRTKKFDCPECGFTYYHNTAAATGCIIQVDKRIILLARAKEPGLGKLDLPGGFVDPGEGVLEGLLREIREELNWDPPIKPGMSLAEYFTLFASFPNIYHYKNIDYNTCDIYFTISAPDLSEKDLSPQAGEIAKIYFVLPQEINLDELAFDSTRRAVKAYLLFLENQQKTNHG